MMNSNTATGGGGSSSSSGNRTGTSDNNKNNNNNNPSVYDYSYLNSNTHQQQHHHAVHHHHHHHHHQYPAPNTKMNNTFHRYTTTSQQKQRQQQQQDHGPSTTTYDPTFMNPAEATAANTTIGNNNNNNSNQLYMAYMNASYPNPSLQLSPRPTSTTTTTTTTHHNNSYQNPYATSNVVTNTAAVLSPITNPTTTTTTNAIVGLDHHHHHQGNRDLSPIPLHREDDSHHDYPNNHLRTIRGARNNNNHHHHHDSTSTTTAQQQQQQQLDQLLFGGNDILMLAATTGGNDLLLSDDSNLLLFPSVLQPQPTTTTTTTTATSVSQLLRRTPPPQQPQQMFAYQQQQQQQQDSAGSFSDAWRKFQASQQQLPSLSNITTSTSKTTSSLFYDHSSVCAATMSQQRALYQQQTSAATLSKNLTSSDRTISFLHTKIGHESWMDEIQLNVTSISMTPISGHEILQRIQWKLQDVVYKYVPCVDFLVNCQQDLRRGIETISAQKLFEKQRGSRSNHTTSKQILREIQYGNQFYTAYISDLSSKFFNETKGKIIQFQNNSSSNDETDMNTFLNDAMKGLQSLEQDARRILSDQQQHIRTSTTASAATVALIQNGCCEAMKSAYLGGMKDGESWGLRKWLSKHGNALHVCTDLECILNACQKLSRSSHTTRLLATQLRQMTKPVLQYLQKEIPQSYQKHSSAHPYLPFFHRLESALRSMSNFDPDDDDVICLDDDDDDEKSDNDVNNNNTNTHNNISKNDVDDDEDDVVEVDPNNVKRAAKYSTNKKRSAIDATSTESDNSPDDDGDDGDVDVTERKRSNITTNGYHYDHHPTNNGNIHYKNDSKYENVDDDNQSSSGESEVQSIVEIIDIIGKSSTNPTRTNTTANGQAGHSNSDWQCSNCFMSNAGSDMTCLICGEENSLKDLLNFSRMEDFFESNIATTSDDENDHDGLPRISALSSAIESSVTTSTLHRRHQVPLWPVPIDEPEVKRSVAVIIANNLERIATIFDQDQQSSIRTINIPDGSFWDGEHYGNALRLFAQIIRSPESYHFLECVDDDQLHQAGNNPLFSHVIKHPLSLRQIARSLLGDEVKHFTADEHQHSNYIHGEDGYLKVRGLSKWNMWVGKELLQAIDLVFLNSLAYGNALNQGRSQHRSSTNQLRKKFWTGITEILNKIDVESRKQSMPTRRAEKSGFVVYKIGES